MLWHQQCWRTFQEEFERETRDGGVMGPHGHAGVNITQVTTAKVVGFPGSKQERLSCAFLYHTAAV
jgi:hypothetical protein